MKIFRRLFRLGLVLFIVAVVLFVAGVLLLNTIAKQMLVSRLRAGTGLDPRVGQVDVGLLSPTIDIDNFKLYNTAGFGGGIFIDMPELHLEYDLPALCAGKLHFKLVRLNLAQVSLIQDKQGRMNVHGLEKKGREHAAAHHSTSATSFSFTGIDTLNITLGQFSLMNLGSGRSQELNLGIQNQIAHNVRSQNNVPGLGVLIAASGGTLSATNANLDLPAFIEGLMTR